MGLVASAARFVRARILPARVIAMPEDADRPHGCMGERSCPYPCSQEPKAERLGRLQLFVGAHAPCESQFRMALVSWALAPRRMGLSMRFARRSAG
jgi:hypothetical protein